VGLHQSVFHGAVNRHYRLRDIRQHNASQPRLAGNRYCPSWPKNILQSQDIFPGSIIAAMH
jgi:hypothetical protein